MQYLVKIERLLFSKISLYWPAKRQLSTVSAATILPVKKTANSGKGVKQPKLQQTIKSKFNKEFSITNKSAIEKWQNLHNMKNSQPPLKSNRKSEKLVYNSRDYDEYNVWVESYIHVCVKANMLETAIKIMFNLLEQNGHRINNPKSLVHIFSGVAKSKSRRFLKLANQLLQISNFNQPFSILCCKLEFCSRSRCSIGEIQVVLNVIKQCGYDLAALRSFCSSNENSIFHSENAVRRVLPNFRSFSVIDFDYKIPLLKNVDNNLTKGFEKRIRMGVDSDIIYTSLLEKKVHLKQFKAEKKYYNLVATVDQAKKFTEETRSTRLQLGKCKVEWQSLLSSNFDESMNNLKRIDINSKMTNILPYLSLLPKSFFIDMMLEEVNIFGNFHSDNYATSKTGMVYTCGYRVLSEINQINDNSLEYRDLIKAYEYYVKYLSNNKNVNNRLLWQYIIEKFNLDVKATFKEYSHNVAKLIGNFIYEIIMKSIFVSPVNGKNDRKVPAFYEVFRVSNSSMERAIKPHPSFTLMYQEANLKEIVFYNHQLPMLIPPIPWTTANHGSYMRYQTPFVRSKSTSNYIDVKLRNISNRQLYPIFDAINTTSSVAWMVNNDILGVVTKLFKNGGDLSLGLPPHPSKYANMKTIEQFEGTKGEFYMYCKRFRKEKAEMYSLWCTELYRLSIANQYIDKYFWFPQNLDFRGRVYTIPPHFSHIGHDISRGLLLFGNGKILGPRGLYWLKIHCINLTGRFKTLTNQERFEMADECLENIVDSAKFPVNGKGWWKKSDEPWQTLAACVEIFKAISSHKHQEYVCHLPIHQDGSCNGLQHYAALGRDEKGAESVNLKKSDRPNDVYSYVVKLVESKRIQDQLDGSVTAAQLEGIVTRKIIKQTVMTTVYGVTRYGARQQVIDKLSQIPNIDKRLILVWAHYIVESTFDCLTTMFTSSKEIKNWLSECASILVDRDVVVEWKTLLGLPVFQPYFSVQKFNLTTFSKENKINKRKQCTAIPPNFIHSLDASHMMLTALYSRQNDFTFVSVHDCYWTHPCSVEEMNRVCREQFVSLHSQPILADLSRQFIQLVHKNKNPNENVDTCNKAFKNIPNTGIISNHLNLKLKHLGKFNLLQVLDSEYFFS